jgi:2-polyprenyl-3-methyl-5-hydroxy-6-metoxy-1,4-benzoquinol methylase
MKTLRAVTNQAFRDAWVTEMLNTWNLSGKRVIDVGAGQQPYRNLIESNGATYFSHDFNSYVPNAAPGGLHIDWPHLNQDFECDILEIPENEPFDFLICTEVLEHVPDPVKTLEKLSRLVASGGELIITVPRMSLIHQAPFHFATGLSEYFFQHFSGVFGMQVEELTLHGDYADFLSQEIRRLFRLPGFFQTPLSKVIRPAVSKDVLSSGGFSVFVRLSKNG